MYVEGESLKRMSNKPKLERTLRYILMEYFAVTLGSMVREPGKVASVADFISCLGVHRAH